MADHRGASILVSEFYEEDVYLSAPEALEIQFVLLTRIYNRMNVWHRGELRDILQELIAEAESRPPEEGGYTESQVRAAPYHRVDIGRIREELFWAEDYEGIVPYEDDLPSLMAAAPSPESDCECDEDEFGVDHEPACPSWQDVED